MASREILPAVVRTAIIIQVSDSNPTTKIPQRLRHTFVRKQKAKGQDRMVSQGDIYMANNETQTPCSHHHSNKKQ
jgi:hypothetical protein